MLRQENIAACCTDKCDPWCHAWMHSDNNRWHASVTLVLMLLVMSLLCLNMNRSYIICMLLLMMIMTRARFNLQWCTTCAVMNENVQWLKAVFAVKRWKKCEKYLYLLSTTEKKVIKMFEGWNGKFLGEIRSSVVESWEKQGKYDDLWSMTKKVVRIFGDEMKIFRGVWVKEVTKTKKIFRAWFLLKTCSDYDCTFQKCETAGLHAAADDERYEGSFVRSFVRSFVHSLLFVYFFRWFVQCVVLYCMHDYTHVACPTFPIVYMRRSKSL